MVKPLKIVLTSNRFDALDNVTHAARDLEEDHPHCNPQKKISRASS